MTPEEIKAASIEQVASVFRRFEHGTPLDRWTGLAWDARYLAAMYRMAKWAVDRLAADEAERSERFPAVERLTAWIRDYGHEKQPTFISDLKTVLGIKPNTSKLDQNDEKR